MDSVYCNYYIKLHYYQYWKKYKLHLSIVWTEGKRYLKNSFIWSFVKLIQSKTNLFFSILLGKMVKHRIHRIFLHLICIYYVCEVGIRSVGVFIVIVSRAFKIYTLPNTLSFNFANFVNWVSWNIEPNRIAIEYYIMAN